MAQRKRKRPRQQRRFPQQRAGNPAPPLKIIQFAQLEGVSECIYFSMQDYSSFDYIQLLPLDNLFFVDEHAPAPISGPELHLAGAGARLLQGPGQAGWKRMGLVSMPGSSAGRAFMKSGRAVKVVRGQAVRMLSLIDWERSGCD